MSAASNAPPVRFDPQFLFEWQTHLKFIQIVGVSLPYLREGGGYLDSKSVLVGSDSLLFSEPLFPRMFVETLYLWPAVYRCMR